MNHRTNVATRFQPLKHNVDLWSRRWLACYQSSVFKGKLVYVSPQNQNYPGFEPGIITLLSRFAKWLIANGKSKILVLLIFALKHYGQQKVRAIKGGKYRFGILAKILVRSLTPYSCHATQTPSPFSLSVSASFFISFFICFFSASNSTS